MNWWIFKVEWIERISSFSRFPCNRKKRFWNSANKTFLQKSSYKKKSDKKIIRVKGIGFFLKNGPFLPYVLEDNMIFFWKEVAAKKEDGPLTHFCPMCPFYTPWKQQETKSFSLSSGGIKWEHWPRVKNLIKFS